MRPVMYIFANRGLNMSPGKLAAQVAHAAVAVNGLNDNVMRGVWNQQGHPKIVMLAEDTDQLQWIERYIKERGYTTRLIIDEGRTEIKAFTPTALGVELVDKDNPQVQEHFCHFKTYREKKVEVVGNKKLWGRVRGK